MSQTAQQDWKRRTLDYVSSINAYVHTGLTNGWDAAGEPPQSEPRKGLAHDALQALRDNQGRDADSFRTAWPPAHAPFAEAEILKDKSQSLPVIALLANGDMIARVGTTYQDGQVVHISGRDVQTVPDMALFGFCPNKRYVANVRADGQADITEGWQGEKTVDLTWPTGCEGVPDTYGYKKEGRVHCERIVAFPCGKKALLIGGDGIFILSDGPAHRLYPTADVMTEQFDWSLKDDPNDPLHIGVSMPHGAVSRDGRLIAIGCQDSAHLVFDEACRRVAEVGPYSEYPHYALFSHDDQIIAFNSCHFYNGCTIGVPTALLPNLKTEPYDRENEAITVLEDGARVYAGVARPDEFIIGDASGYVRAFDETGAATWQLFLGSSIGDMDISDDGRFLLVSTYAGFLAKYDLEAVEKAPHQIGTGDQCELFRWVFWKGEDPLFW